jgi:hypothetical protein
MNLAVEEQADFVQKQSKIFHVYGILLRGHGSA